VAKKILPIIKSGGRAAMGRRPKAYNKIKHPGFILRIKPEGLFHPGVKRKFFRQ
jgi:hypothetical protein